ALPEVSFVTALKIAGTILSQKSPTGPDDLVDAEEQGASKEVSRQALELLRRADLIVYDKAISPSDALREVDKALTRDDLDRVSKIFERYAPYAALIRALKASPFLTIKAATAAVATVTESKPSAKSVERFIRIPTYLGQAWTIGEKLMDGTSRPDDDEVV